MSKVERYSGERRIEGTDLRTRCHLTLTGTYGQVIRDVGGGAGGHEGDSWNPPRPIATVTSASTRRFPAYHLGGGALAAVAELARTVKP